MDLTTALTNVVSKLPGPFWTLLFAVAALMAMIYLMSVTARLMRANRYPGQASVSAAEILFVLVLGAALVNLPGAMQHVSASIGLGTVSYGALDYPGAASFGKLAPAVNAVLTLAAMAGGIFVLRGFAYWRKAAAGGQGSDDYGWKGFTHVAGGTALVQIIQVIEMLRKTTGGLW